MSSNPIDGGPGGVPYTRGMWRRFAHQMGTLAEAERREEEKPVEQKADDIGEIVRELRSAEQYEGCDLVPLDFNVLKKAADALERLSAERDEYVLGAQSDEKQILALKARAEAVEAEAAKWKKAYEEARDLAGLAIGASVGGAPHTSDRCQCDKHKNNCTHPFCPAVTKAGL